MRWGSFFRPRGKKRRGSREPPITLKKTPNRERGVATALLSPFLFVLSKKETSSLSKGKGKRENPGSSHRRGKGERGKGGEGTSPKKPLNLSGEKKEKGKNPRGVKGGPSFPSPSKEERKRGGGGYPCFAQKGREEKALSYTFPRERKGEIEIILTSKLNSKGKESRKLISLLLYFTGEGGEKRVGTLSLLGCPIPHPLLKEGRGRNPPLHKRKRRKWSSISSTL